MATASTDNAATLWEADTGRPVGTPTTPGHGQQHCARVGGGAGCCASQGEADQLASLAEAVSQNDVSDTGSLTAIDGRECLQKLIRQGEPARAPS